LIVSLTTLTEILGDSEPDTITQKVATSVWEPKSTPDIVPKSKPNEEPLQKSTPEPVKEKNTENNVGSKSIKKAKIAIEVQSIDSSISHDKNQDIDIDWALSISSGSPDKRSQNLEEAKMMAYSIDSGKKPVEKIPDKIAGSKMNLERSEELKKYYERDLAEFMNTHPEANQAMFNKNFEFVGRLK